jgi:hypothetical protein
MRRKIDGRTYMMRDKRPVVELRKLYADYLGKYGSTITIHQWLRERGKVSIEIVREKKS